MTEEQDWVPLRAGFGGKQIGRAKIDLKTGTMQAEIDTEVAHILRDGLVGGVYSMSFEGRAVSKAHMDRINAYFTGEEDTVGVQNQPENYVPPVTETEKTEQSQSSGSKTRRNPFAREDRRFALEKAVEVSKDLTTPDGDYGKLVVGIAGQFVNFIENGVTNVNDVNSVKEDTK